MQPGPPSMSPADQNGTTLVSGWDGLSVALARVQRYPLFLILLIASPLVFAGLANHRFWLMDEPFVAEVSREMAVSGDYAVPRLNGEPFLEKPPLHYAGVALAYDLFGVTPFAARLPSALFSLGTLIFTFFLGRRLLGNTAALLGTLVLPTLLLFFYAGHYCLVDPALAFFFSLGLWAASHAFGEDARAWAPTAFWAACTLTFLSKGFVGPAFLVLGVAAFAAWRREWSFFHPRRHLIGATIFLLVILVWVFALWRAGGGPYLREALLANSLGRFLSISSMVPRDDSIATHEQPIYAYLQSLAWSFFPWTPALFLPLVNPMRRLLKRGSVQHEFKVQGVPEWGPAFLASVLLTGLAILTVSHYKRGMYLLPLLPVIALLVGRSAAFMIRRPPAGGSAERVLIWIQVCTTALFTLGLPVAYLYLSGWEPASVRHGPDLILAGAWTIVGLLGLVLAVWKVRAPGKLFGGLWALTAAGLLAFSVFCVPLMEPQKTLSGFFDEVARIENARGNIPCLYLANESYIGLACLHFGRVLPSFLTKEGQEIFKAQGQRADLVTDEGGMDYLSTKPGAKLDILASRVETGPSKQMSVYLITYERPKPRSDNQMSPTPLSGGPRSHSRHSADPDPKGLAP